LPGYTYGMNSSSFTRRKGPWTHRVSIFFLCLLLGLLSYWLLGFVIRDVGDIRGPAWEEVEKKHLDPALVRQQTQLEEQLESIKREIANQTERQSLLRDATRTAQTTIDQLLQMQKLSLEKGIPFPESETEALRKAREAFLAGQADQTRLNEDIGARKEEQRQVEARLRESNKALDAQRGLARQEWNELNRAHNIKLAIIKLAILLPIALLVGWLFVKTQGSVYRPMVYAVGFAVFWKVGVVIHAHFPSRYFKYIVILIALGIVLKFLLFLLKMIVSPRRDWLLKQYREAYEKFLCPICGYPIRRGPLKYLFWTSRSIRKLVIPATTDVIPDEAYTCPVCTTTLYEECPDCNHIRASLLPACDHCGAEKESAVTLPSR